MSITIKTLFNEDTRRFSINKNATFEELLCNICSVYNRHDNLTLSYTDDEGDLITITSDSELHEAFRVHPHILRVLVTKPVMKEENPLFQSWVVLSKQEPSEDVKAALHGIEQLSSKIQVCQSYSKVVQKESLIDSWYLVHQNNVIPDAGSSPVLAPVFMPAVEAKLNIKQIVSKLSHEIAQELEHLSDDIASLVMDTHHETVKNDMASINQMLESISSICKNESDTILAEVTTNSDGALAQVSADSSMILDSVHSHSKLMTDMLDQYMADNALNVSTTEVLRHGVSDLSNALSTFTVSQCLSEADAIRDIVMSV